jgi:hypothetical protein
MQIKGGRKGSGNIREEEYFYLLYLCLDGYSREMNTVEFGRWQSGMPNS